MDAVRELPQFREAGECRPLPRTEDVASRLLLPLYAQMDETQAAAVVDALLDAV